MVDLFYLGSVIVYHHGSFLIGSRTPGKNKFFSTQHNDSNERNCFVRKIYPAGNFQRSWRYFINAKI